MNPVEEGMRRAAQMRAILTPEQLVAGDALAASAVDRLRRMFCSPENSKGRQTMYIATEMEYLEWRIHNNNERTS